MLNLKFYTTTNTEITHDKESGVPLKEPKAGKGNRKTSVVLYSGSTYQIEAVLATASVTRYFKDIDIPVLGKKCAVEKLIKEGDFTRKERTEIWKALWKHSAKVESLRHGAYKEEILQIKQADRWRNWDKNLMKI